jgi:hypothetical protein
MAAGLKIAYDPSLKRPGCVLLQGALGGNIPDFPLLFPPDTWLLAPTPGMALYPVSPQQLDYLVQLANGQPRSKHAGEN